MASKLQIAHTSHWPLAMRVAWTGHRPYYFRDSSAAERTVRAAAADLRTEFGAELVFLTGGQRGVDLWAAESGFELGVPVHVTLPLPAEQFCHGWEQADVERLRRVMERAASVEIVAGAASVDQAYTERNRRVSGTADLLVAVWTGIQQGGTWETIQVARRLGKPIREMRLEAAGRPLRPEQRGL